MCSHIYCIDVLDELVFLLMLYCLTAAARNERHFADAQIKKVVMHVRKHPQKENWNKSDNCTALVLYQYEVGSAQ
jgi:hypothetical protein